MAPLLSWSRTYLLVLPQRPSHEISYKYGITFSCDMQLRSYYQALMSSDVYLKTETEMKKQFLKMNKL